MNVQTITMPKEEALAAYREYRDIVRPQPEDNAIMTSYKALAEGHAVIDIARAIQTAGLDEKGRPKLAIAQAHWRSAYYWPGNAVLYFRNQEARRGRGSVARGQIPVAVDRSFLNALGSSTWTARVPLIPAKVRPQFKLENYHILWEAEWEEMPRDPLLLKHLAGSLYAVLAVWDLTEIERAVMAQGPG